MTTNQALAEIVRLRTDLALTSDVLAQTQRALEAERAARVRAEGDNMALRATIQRALDGCPFCRVGRCRADAHEWLRDVCATDHPGAPLLAEMDAGRAYLAYVFETYPPTSATEMALRAAYDAAREG